MNYKLYLFKGKLITKLENFLIWMFTPIRKYYTSPKVKERKHRKYVKNRINKLKKDIFYYIKRQDEILVINEYDLDNGRYGDIDSWSNFNVMEDVKYLITSNFFLKNKFSIDKTTYGEYMKNNESSISYIEDSLKDTLVYVIKK